MKLQGGLPEVLDGGKPGNPLPSYAGSGVVLLNVTGHLLFMNHQAQLLLRELQPLAVREQGNCLLPVAVHTVLRELQTQLVSCDHPKDCESFTVERLCLSTEHRLLLRGVCIPEEPLHKNSRFLVIIEQLSATLECPDQDVRQRYHLTEREQMVIIYLMLGFTNKEIANRLNLSEYTVKEHLKRIMQKTRTTTRTGLLARMIFPSPQSGGGLLPRAMELERSLAMD